jgi:hypothetical protein
MYGFGNVRRLFLLYSYLENSNAYGKLRRKIPVKFLSRTFVGKVFPSDKCLANYAPYKGGAA